MPIEHTGENSKKSNVLEYVYRMLLDPNSRFSEIIGVLESANEPITLDEIAKRLGMNKKTAANNLSMLVKTGLIKRIKKSYYHIPLEIKSLLKLIMMLSVEINKMKKGNVR